MMMMMMMVVVMLSLLATTTRGGPLNARFGPAEAGKGVDKAYDLEFPDWSHPSNWLQSQIPVGRVMPDFPESLQQEWHVTNSPINGLVTDSTPRNLLGITAKELDHKYHTQVLPRLFLPFNEYHSNVAVSSAPPLSAVQYSRRDAVVLRFLLTDSHIWACVRSRQ